MLHCFTQKKSLSVGRTADRISDLALKNVKKIAQTCLLSERDIVKRPAAWLIGVVKELGEVFSTNNESILLGFINDANKFAPEGQLLEA